MAIFNFSAVRCLSLTLHQFRSYPHARFDFTPGINLLVGANGAGKTNVLEALHYLALTKSFLTSTDAYAITHGASHFEVSGEFAGERRDAFRARLRFVPGSGKDVAINGAQLESLSAMIGRVPAVLMAPQDYLLTAGAPEERRKFVNNLLSQAQPLYLDTLLRYNRVMRQRNEVLFQARRRRGQNALLLDSWTEEMAMLGERIVAARRRGLERMAHHLAQAYAALGEQVEQPSFRYAQAGVRAGEAETPLLERYENARAREIEAGRTLIGPHRDDLVFYLNGVEVRRYASQGQHRTFGIALRLAQFFYLKEEAGEVPLLLLDDLFGNLDAQRTRLLEELLRSPLVGQSFVTDTRADLFGNPLGEAEGHQIIVVTETLRGDAAV